MRITPFLLVGFDGQIIDLPGSIVLPTRSAPPVPNRGLKGHVKRLPYCQTSVSGDLVPFCLDAGRRVLGTATGPSGQYVYITRLPYECQTKLPEMSDADKGPYAIGIRAGYDPNSPGQNQGAPSARQERRLHDDLRCDSRGDRSVHRREVRAGLHPQAHDRIAEGERRRPSAAREVRRLGFCRGRGPQRGPRVCPTSAPQSHGRGRAIGRRGGDARPLKRASTAGPCAAVRDGIRMGLETAQRTGNQSFLDSFGFARPKVLVIGCGGAGGNSVHRLHRMGIHGARTVVVNTDAVHLDSIQADRKLLIGRGVTHGMGAGGRPEIGERCAEISEQELRNQIGDADLTFITVGLGGGTGTGVAPHVAELAQAAGSVVISLATTPFRAERGRMTNARAGIQRLRDRTDSLILLDNNRLLDLVPNLPVEQAFAVMDHLIGEVIKGITESITVPSLINLDFSDVRSILQAGGMSTVFYGENAEDNTQRLVSDTLNNPLLEVDYRGANGALIHISAGPGLRLRTAHEVVEGLTAAMRPDANVIFGVRVDRKYDGILRVLAIMTGVRSPMVDAVRESVSIADVVSDRSSGSSIENEFPRTNRRR